jgi:hypothetical protein
VFYPTTGPKDPQKLFHVLVNSKTHPSSIKAAGLPGGTPPIVPEILSASIANATGVPDSTVTETLQVITGGAEAASFNISVADAPNDWPLELGATNGTAASNATFEAPVNLTIPPDAAPGVYTWSFGVVGPKGGNATATWTVTVEPASLPTGTTSATNATDNETGGPASATDTGEDTPGFGFVAALAAAAVFIGARRRRS